MNQLSKDEALYLAEETLYVETGLNNEDSVFFSREKIYDSLSVYEEIGDEVLIEEGIFSQEGVLNPDFVKYGVGITVQFVKEKHHVSDTLIKHKVHLFSPEGAAYIEALLRLKLNLE